MFRTMFFKGLRPSLKDKCRHLCDESSTFDSLKAALRKLGMEHHLPMKKSAIAKSFTHKEEPDDNMSVIRSLDQSINYKV